MGGLQGKLIGRSKSVLGHGVIEFSYTPENEIEPLLEELKKEGYSPIPELEVELLVKYGNYYSPMIVHGLDPRAELPDFLNNRTFEDLVLPRSLSLKINSTVGDMVRIMSPAHLDGFLGDVPRMASLYVDYLVSTEVPEVDDFHGWARLLRVQALLGERVVNRIRLYHSYEKEIVLKALKNSGPPNSRILSWEDVNATLVWALSLETSIMVFLFSTMTLLVSLAITSGLLIFFSKTRSDLASFWVMGTSEKNLFGSSKIFLTFLTFFSVLFGLALGALFLYGLDKVGPNIMPDVFVDRKIPVRITWFGVGISFFIPFIVSLTFAWLSLKSFRKDVDYLTYIRTLGS